MTVHLVSQRRREFVGHLKIFHPKPGFSKKSRVHIFLWRTVRLLFHLLWSMEFPQSINAQQISVIFGQLNERSFYRDFTKLAAFIKVHKQCLRNNGQSPKIALFRSLMHFNAIFNYGQNACWYVFTIPFHEG